MEKIVIEASSHSPFVEFENSGKLKMEGRSFPEDALSFYKPLIEFIERLESESVTLDVNLEYFNTASSKKLLDMFKHLDANRKIHEIQVNWHFEEGDEDSIETAEIYEDSLIRCKFRYLEYAEVAG